METKEQRAKFQQKNERRKAHKGAQGAADAKQLRVNGVSMRVKTTIPMDLGEDIVYDEDIMGTPGAFGNGTNQEWNDRLAGTSGIER